MIGANPVYADTYPNLPSVYVTNAASLQVDTVLTSSDNRTWHTLTNSHPIPAGETKRITFSGVVTKGASCLRYLKFVWNNGEFTSTRQLNVCQNPSIQITRAGKF
ncbi:MAG: hypothetical protein PUP91_21335 [Rhizonema sp. PD37]|nr:hypothetical protein [Rhizonema sp. PD37]